MSTRGLWLGGALLATLPLGARGQAMVEYTLGVGRAAASAAGMKKAGEAAAKTFEKLGQTLEPGGRPGAMVASSTSKIPVPPEAPKRLGPFLDPATITAGLTRNELLNRFGDPLMMTAGGRGSEAAEVWWYRSSAGEGIVLTLAEGKVATVASEAKRQQQSAAVVIVQ